MPSPEKVSVLAFNVDFGDCFLVRFSYADKKIGNRHVLIDFGATRATKEKLTEIAEQIARQCKGKLDILVATHRHKDHISGFTRDEEGDSGDIIRKLKPTIVMQPWTEDPEIAVDASGPRSSMRAFAGTLKGMSAFAAGVKDFAEVLKKDEDDARRLGFSKDEVSFLSFLGENNIANPSAVNNLIFMGRASKSGKPMFLNADMEPDITKVLPGVKLKVLGPPTPNQHESVRKQNPRNNDQYWLRRAADLSVTGGPIRDKEGRQSLFAITEPNADPSQLSPHRRWIARRVMRLRKDMLLPIVRALDKAMNNTSLILLFQIEEKKTLLFPGDAQWENWEYALEAAPRKDEYRKLLSGVDLYKVGHHGSLNATPKLLWKLFEHKGKPETRNRLKSVMSTKKNIHGKTPETAVPRTTLVRELKRSTDHFSTEDLPHDKPFHQIDIKI